MTSFYHHIKIYAQSNHITCTFPPIADATDMM